MEHLLPQSPLTSHYDHWSPYHEHGIDHAGDSYITAHHVNVEQGNYQNLHYGHFHHQGYAISQNNEAVQHAPLTPPDANMSYWPTAQAPTTASGPPLSMLPLDPMYYPQSCYENQNVSLTEHRHAATEDHYQPDIASACAGTTYGTAGMMYPEQDATLATTTHATALPAHAQHPTIAHNQSESGHDPAQHVATVPQTALYERNAMFRSPDNTSYTHLGPYVDPFTTTTAAQQHQHQHQHQQQQQQPQHYSSPIAREDRKPYLAASPPAPEAQGQYAAPAPTPARSKPKTESPSQPPPRPKSPMGHLPYPEEIAAAKAVESRRQRRPSSMPSSHGVAQQQQQQSPSPASTPMPLTPVQQTLTFITYPETEPRAYRDGRGGSGVDSDDLGDDDDGGSSPSRRGRRGKKQPKKDPFLACFFCRGRKIACQPKNEAGEDRTCTQCAKRHLPCNYPLTSRRGQRKPHDCPDQDGAGASVSSPASSTSSGGSTSNGNSSTNGVSARACSKSRARASSKLSTTTTTSSLVTPA